MLKHVILISIFCLSINQSVYAKSKSSSSVAQLVQQAKALLANKSYQQAYTLLQAKEGSYGGQAKFDYYLGVAALQSGKPAEAVFALERALDVQPNLQQARAELGRAYYYLGENKSARLEFEQVKSHSQTPAGVKNSIDKFLAAIDSRFDSSGRRLEFYLEGSVGSDSNVNAATDKEEVILPAISTAFAARLPEDSQAIDSAFFEVKPGVRYTQPLKEDLNLFASGDFTIRDINDDDQFSSQTINVTGGLAKLAGANQYHGLLSFQQYEVDELDFGRDVISISGQWIKTLSPKSKLTSYLQISDVAYDDGVRDGAINTVGINWLQGNAKRVTFYGAYYGQEKIDDNSQRHQAKDFIGFKVGTRHSWNTKALFANVVYQFNSFEADDPLQLTKRDGQYLSLNTGIDIPITRKFTITPKLTFSQNKTDDNLDLFDYDRTVFEVTAVYNF